MKPLYHGGVPGMKAGDKILPPKVTGASNLLQYAREIDPDGAQRDDRVYLTTESDMAALFASVFPGGDVYEVQPNETLEDDPDCLEPGISFQCASATIINVVRKHCVFPNIKGE